MSKYLKSISIFGDIINYIEEVIFLLPSLLFFYLTNTKIHYKCKNCNSFIFTPELLRIWHCKNCTNQISYFKRLYELQEKKKFKKFTEISPVYKRITSEIQNGRVLDAGCGSGSLLKELRLKNHIKLYGIDFSDAAINISRREIPSGEFVVGNITNMPFKNEYFDVLICCELLEHIENPNAAINECYRVLKKNSILHISIPTSWGIYSKRHKKGYSSESILKLLKESNFKIIYVKHIGLYLSFVTKFFKYLSHLFSREFSLSGPLNVTLPKSLASYVLIKCQK